MKKILIVDDDPMVCDLFHHAFRNEYNVESVHDGLSAIESILQRKPDLVIIDFHMPHLNGISVVQNILFDPNNPRGFNIKFILISAYLTGERIKQWIDLFDDPIFFTKPFDINVIKETVRVLLNPKEA